MMYLREFLKLMLLWALGVASGIVLMLILSGCTTVEKGDFRYTNTLFSKEIGHLRANIDPNTGKVVSVELDNYTSDNEVVLKALELVK